MEENSSKCGSIHSDSNSCHPIGGAHVLASSNLYSTKLREPLDISNTPKYYIKSSVKELPLESSYTGFALKNKNQEIRILGNLTDQKYFVICNFCFWCASCTNARFSITAENTCPSCSEGMIEWLAIAAYENYVYNQGTTGGIDLKFSSRRAEGTRA